MALAQWGLLLTLLAPLKLCGVSAFPPHPGSLDVGEDSYVIKGYSCDNQTLRISYPTEFDKGPFPIVSYGHGSGGSMPWDLINGVATLGIVVVAPQGWCSDQWRDMVHALNASMANASLHPVLSHVDWSHVGFLGHSAGGYAAVTAGAYAHNISQFVPDAVVASHGADIDGSKYVKSPIMYTSGSGDPRRHKSAEGFANCPARPKVFAVLEGGGHMEPEGQGRLNPFDALFLGCHLQSNSYYVSCARIYGNGSDSLCNANAMTTCDIDLPAPPTTPAPPALCNFEQDTDYDTQSQLGEHDASSTDECCRLCMANSTCAAAVFSPGWRRHGPTCWFKRKDELDKKVHHGGVVACVPKNMSVGV